MNTTDRVWLPGWRIALPIVVLLWGVYLFALHPWLMSWGAAPTEAAMILPGDDPSLPSAAYFTRAITVDAPPSAVWPWIVQIGQGHAGFYSNTWLENITGADIHNANSIHPEWQGRQIGDSVPLARPDLLFGFGATGHTDVVLLEQDRAIANAPGRVALQPTDDGARTRLLFREPLASQGPILIRSLVWDPMHFVMVERMLRGIKERAEGQPLVPALLLQIARMGWLLAGLGVSLAFTRRRQWLPWLLLPTLLVLPGLSSSGDWSAALAAWLAYGITLLGALTFGRRWWPAYLLIASAVLLTLLLAPDSYTAFGLAFDLLAAAAVARLATRFGAASHRPRPAITAA